MKRLIIITLLFSFSLFSEDLINVKEHVLDNGLKILIVEDHNSPLVVCRLYYKVGSVNETIGKSGLSHMLEHMMFKGTKRIGVTDLEKEQSFVGAIDSLFELSDNARFVGDTISLKKYRKEAMEVVTKQRKYIKNNELWGLYQKEGGTALNAYTSNLLTAYIVTLPANKVELFMWLESDRMANPVLREFYTERDVVIEERRLRYENSPYGRYYETLRSMIYEAHPFRIPTIGYMSDLHHLKRQEALAHFKKFYVPNNAILVLVGDIKEADALKLTKEYFGPIPRGPVKSKIFTKDPIQVGQKSLVVKKDLTPLFDIFFKTPGMDSDKIFGLDILEGVLNGKSGRLYKKLVTEKKLVTSIYAGNYISKYQSYFKIHAEVVAGVSHDEVKRVVMEEITKLQNELIHEYEFEKVKNSVTAASINGLRSNESIADRLAFYEIYNSWTLVNRFADEVKKVKLKTVRNIAREFFIEENSIVGYLINKKGDK